MLFRVRYVWAGFGVVFLVAGLATAKVAQISTLVAAGKQMQAAGPPPESVATAYSQEQTWGGSVNSVGTIASVKGVTISNEVPGIISKIRFDSGAFVKKGEVLVELDSATERAQLASLEARKDLAETNAGRTRALVAESAVPRAQLDTDESALKSSSAEVKALRAQIQKKTVRAPFSGHLGIRQVNVGQYLNPGATITDLEAIDMVFVDFTLPQQLIDTVSVGIPVQVTVKGLSGLSADGAIAAISPAVDPTTRTLKLRATVPNEGEKLRPGMFAAVSVRLTDQKKVVAIPVSAVVRAPYGDSVFIVEDKRGPDGTPAKAVRQQFVRLGEGRGDFVAVADGIRTGQEVVTAGGFKLRNGARVAVNNDIKIEPQLNPQLENH
jgi:membrane fusion protein, multidrug efflux system